MKAASLIKSFLCAVPAAAMMFGAPVSANQYLPPAFIPWNLSGQWQPDTMCQSEPVPDEPTSDEETKTEPAVEEPDC